MSRKTLYMETTTVEVALPYMLNERGETVYDVMTEMQFKFKALPAGKQQ